MRQLSTGILFILLSGCITSVLAAPTTRLPPAPSPSEFTHSSGTGQTVTQPDKTTLRQRTESTARKHVKKKVARNAEKAALQSLKNKKQR